MRAGHWGGREGHGWKPVAAYCQGEGDKSTKEVHQRELLLVTPRQSVAALIQEGRLMANRSNASQSACPTLLTRTMLERAGWVSASQASLLQGSSPEKASGLQDTRVSSRNEHRFILFPSTSLQRHLQLNQGPYSQNGHRSQEAPGQYFSGGP